MEKAHQIGAVIALDSRSAMPFEVWLAFQFHRFN